MSGFSGFTTLFNTYTSDKAKDVLRCMTNAISHRGPDRLIFGENDNIHIGMCLCSHNNIASVYTNDLYIAFDGAIYNKRELINTLDIQDDDSDTRYNMSDTELIAHLYKRYGNSFVRRLRGMFSIVICDSKDNSILAVRDTFGMKPLYYTLCDDELVFCSEIKGILMYPWYHRSVNEEALAAYLSFGASTLQETFFKNIYKLLPGHSLTYKNGKLNISQYSNIEFKPDSSKSLSDFAEDINAMLKDSVQCHTPGNKPVGSFLAAGVDSNYITALMETDCGFSTFFDYDKCDDIDYTNSLADILKVNNISSYFTSAQCFAHIPDIVTALEEPLADHSAIPQFFAYKNAAQHTYIVLSGDGADELFGGYNIYSEPKHVERYRQLPKSAKKSLIMLEKMLTAKSHKARYERYTDLHIEQRYMGNNFVFTNEELNLLLRKPVSKTFSTDITKPYYDKVARLDDVAKMQYIDINFTLANDTLLKADKLGMFHSLEVRMPYLDRAVFEVARKLPTNFKVSEINNKIALRTAANNYLPKAITRRKRGSHRTPVAAWLRNEHNYRLIKDAFVSPVAKQYFNTDILMHYLISHKDGKADYSTKIWAVYMFLIWYSIYISK